jgi:allophanate hydrolase
VEFTMAGLDIRLEQGACRVGFAGGDFTVKHNGRQLLWPSAIALEAGDVLAITPGQWGNYGYLRFDADIAVPAVMGSTATSSRAGLGGLDGRALRAGDVIELTGRSAGTAADFVRPEPVIGPIRVMWGLHADIFPQTLRERFLATAFTVSSRLDRMGVRLEDRAGVFAGATALSLVSDAIVPGDIQVLGDGTPIVLMRDHQPTGGYPRIATIISADLDRFAQLRPGSPVAFESVTVEHAHALLRSLWT